MRYFVVLLTLFTAACLLPVPSVLAAATQQIVAVVNEDVISGKDFDNRLKLIMVSSGLPNNDEIRAKLAPQILNSLIEEQVMLQEARNMDITVEPQEIENGFAMIAQQNKTEAGKFKEMLQRGGIDLSTMSRQIEAQVAWGKVVQAKLRPKVIVSDRDVDDVLERLKAKIGTTEYLAAEVFLPVDSPAREKEVSQFATRMVKEVKAGKASFYRLAQQFSKAAGAANGGDMGWVSQDQASEEIIAALKTMQKNGVSDPIRSPLGFHILFLRDTRAMTQATLPSRDQIYYNIGTQRLERLQRRHLMDLRAASFVDVRV